MTVEDLELIIKDLPKDMEVLLDACEDELEGSRWSYRVRLPNANPEVKMVGRVNFGYAIATRACRETKGAKKCLIL